MLSAEQEIHISKYSSDDQTLKNSPEGKHCIGLPSVTGEKDEEQESNFDHVAEDSRRTEEREVGTMHQHHACKLCGHLRRGHICTNPNGKANRLPLVTGISNNRDVVQMTDSLSLKAFKIIMNFSSAENPISYSDIYNRINQNNVENDIIRKSFAAKLMKSLTFLTGRGDVVVTVIPLPTPQTIHSDFTFEVLVPARLNTNGIAKSENLRKAYSVSPEALPRELVSENFLMKKRKKYPELPFTKEPNASSAITQGFIDSGCKSNEKEELQSGRAGRAVEQYDLATGRCLRRYASMQEASVAMGQKPHYIAYHVFGKGATFSKSVFGWREVTLPSNSNVVKSGGLGASTGNCILPSNQQKYSLVDGQELPSTNVGVSGASTVTSTLSPSEMCVDTVANQTDTIPVVSLSLSHQHSSGISSMSNDSKGVKSEVDENCRTDSQFDMLADSRGVGVNPKEYEDILLLRKYMERYMHRTAAAVPTWDSFMEKVRSDCLSEHDSDDNLELLKLKRMKSMGRVKDKNKDKNRPADGNGTLQARVVLTKTSTQSLTETAPRKGQVSCFQEMSSLKWKKQQIENELNAESKKVLPNTQGRKILLQIDPQTGKVLRTYKSGQEASKALGRQANYISYYVFGIGSRLHKSVFLWRRSWQMMGEPEKAEASIDALKVYMDRYTNKNRVPSWSSFLHKYEDGTLSDLDDNNDVESSHDLVSGRHFVTCDSDTGYSRHADDASKQGRYEEISTLLVQSLKRLQGNKCPANIDNILLNMAECQRNDVAKSQSQHERDKDLPVAAVCSSVGSNVFFSKKMVEKVISKCLKKGEVTVQPHTKVQDQSTDNTKSCVYCLNPLYKKNAYEDTPFILCMDISCRKPLYVFSTAQEVSQILRIPAKAVYAVCQGWDLSTHGITFRWFHPDSEPYPDNLVSAANVRRDFMHTKMKKVLGMCENEKDETIRSSTRGVKRSMPQLSGSTKTRNAPDQTFVLKGKSNVPLCKTSMITVSSRTGRTRKLTYRREYTYEGSGLGVEDATMQTHDRYGELKNGLKKRKVENQNSQKKALFEPICSSVNSLDELKILPSRTNNIELSNIRSYIGSVFTHNHISKFVGYNSKRGVYVPHPHQERFKVTDLCINTKFEGALFFKFYSLDKYPKRCPRSLDDFDFSDCMEMLFSEPSVIWVNAERDYSTDKFVDDDDDDDNENNDGDNDDDESDGNVEKNSFGHLRRLQARQLFASRVFEAAQALKLQLFTSDQLLQYMEANFEFESISRSTLCQGIKRCIFLGQLVQQKNHYELSTPHSPKSSLRKRLNTISDDEIPLHVDGAAVYQQKMINPSVNAPPTDTYTYSVNPRFKGLGYDSPILCTCLSGSFIQIFKSVAETSDFFQIDEEVVRKICHGLPKKNLGISLEYASESELQAVRALQSHITAMGNPSTIMNSVDNFPVLWSVEDAWKHYVHEAKSLTRKRLQKLVHSCVESLHTSKIPIDAFTVYRRIVHHFVGKGIHPIHVEEVLQLLTGKGFFTVVEMEHASDRQEDDGSITEDTCRDVIKPVWIRKDDNENVGKLPGWPMYMLSTGYKHDFETAPVVILSSEDEPLKEFPSINDSTLLNTFSLDKGAILKVLFRKQSSHKGLHFKWADDMNDYEIEELNDQLDENVMQRLVYLTSPQVGGRKSTSEHDAPVRKTNRPSLLSSKLTGIYVVDHAHYSQKKIQSLPAPEDGHLQPHQEFKLKKLVGHNFNNYYAVSMRAYCARHEVDVHNFHANVDAYDPSNSFSEDGVSGVKFETYSTSDDNDLDSFLLYCRRLSVRIGSVVKVKVTSATNSNSDGYSCSDDEDLSIYTYSRNGDSDEQVMHGMIARPTNQDHDPGSLGPTKCKEPAHIECLNGKFVAVKTVCVVGGGEREASCVSSNSIEQCNARVKFVTVYDGIRIQDITENDIISIWHEEQGNLIDIWHMRISKYRLDDVKAERQILLQEWECLLKEKLHLQWTESEVAALISGLGPRHKSGAPNMTRVYSMLASQTSTSRSKQDILKFYYSYFCAKNSHQSFSDIKSVFRCAERILKGIEYSGQGGDVNYNHPHFFDLSAWRSFSEANQLSCL